MSFPILPPLPASLRALVLLSALPLAAQSYAVVPAGQAVLDGNSSRLVAGLTVTGRQQVLIAARHLTGLVGQPVHGLFLRRDHGSAFESAGGQAAVVVRLGVAARPVTAPVEDFSGNSLAPVEVFRGVVDVPKAKRPAAPSIAWSSDNAIRMRFSAPYAYAGGDLVVEIEGGPIGGGGMRWYADGVGARVAGVVTAHGAGCGAHGYAGGAARRASVGARDLIAGENARFTLWGEPGAVALLGLAESARPRILDLGFAGAPGCGLGVNPGMTIPAIVSQPFLPGDLAGAAVAELRLPSQAGVLGAQFAAQWFEFARGGLTTSETLECRVASEVPSLGLSVVSQIGSRPVDIDLTRAPVLRFELQ